MPSTDRIAPLRVVIVGAGVASLEAVLALHDLGETRLRLTIVAPDADFSLRPVTVAHPFSRGHADKLPIQQFADEHRATFVRDAVVGVDAQRHAVRCASGREVRYDRLVLAPGAIARRPFPHAITFGVDGTDAMSGLLADIEQGYTSSVGFVVPRGSTWPLPLYELALLTAQEVWTMGMSGVQIHLVTPELAPLAIFGGEASEAVARELEAARIQLHKGLVAHVARQGRVETGFGTALDVERVVTLPSLEGPALEGVPATGRGFIPVDEFGAVSGMEHAYAVGDVTSQPIKQGGLACQQADVAARHIAAAAGASVTAEPFAPVLRGRLLTGSADRFLRRDAERRSEAAAEPLWWPPAKVASRYLAPYLESKGLVTLPVQEEPGSGIDVEVPLRWDDHYSADVLGLDPLGPPAGARR